MMLNFNIQVLFLGLSLTLIGCDRAKQSTPSTSSTPLTSPTQPSEQPTSTSSPALKTAQIRQRKTVAEYFLAIPAEYLRLSQAGSNSTLDRRQLLEQAKQGQQNSLYDPQNGYLRIVQEGDTCSTLTVAIFSRPSASLLVALSYACAGVDQLNILDPDQNWRSVTRTVLPTNLTPDPNLDQLEIELPQFGRTIEIRREQNNQI